MQCVLGNREARTRVRERHDIASSAGGVERSAPTFELYLLLVARQLTVGDVIDRRANA